MAWVLGIREQGECKEKYGNNFRGQGKYSFSGGLCRGWDLLVAAFSELRPRRSGSRAQDKGLGLGIQIVSMAK